MQLASLLTRILRKGAGHAQISPLHHACLFPCHPMSFICSFRLGVISQPRLMAI